MIKAVFFDLSGVLYEGSRALPGALITIERLQRSGRTLRFVTNTSRKPRKSILADLGAMGFNILPEQLYTAPATALAYCQQHQLRPYCLVHPAIRGEFSGLDTSNPNAVILGDAADDFTYQNLDQAFGILMAGGTLVATGNNRYFKDDDGLHLDAGPFVQALEYAAGVKAVVTGKPSTDFFRQVVASTPYPAENILMIGDDVMGDIDGARRAGLQACLVKTGKYQKGDELRLSPPAEVAADVREALARFGV